MTAPTPLIRPLRPDDAEAVHAIRQQPLVMRYTSATPAERLTAVRAFIDGLPHDDYILAAELDGRVVGMAGLQRRKGKEAHAANLGICVHDGVAGRGVGAALMAALIDLADHWLNLTRIELDVVASNTRAIRLYERFGFEREGVRRQASFGPDGYDDLVIMARLR